MVALNDPSPRVQFQAIQTIGRFGVLFPTHLHAMIDKFLPTMISLLHGNYMGQCNGICERVRGHSATAMINLTDPENCTSEMLLLYQDSLLSALCVCLQSAPLSVQLPCLTLLGYVV